MSLRRYAEGTTVEVDRTQAAIRGLVEGTCACDVGWTPPMPHESQCPLAAHAPAIAAAREGAPK